MQKQDFVAKAKATLDAFYLDEWTSTDENLSAEHWRALLVAWGHGFATAEVDRNRPPEQRQRVRERAEQLELVGLGIAGPKVPGPDKG